MKILITGKNSYIGESFSSYALDRNHAVDTLDVIDNQWNNVDFSGYDVVVHVAAIVHKQEKEYTREEYFRVNSDLAVEVAKKAKQSNVGQFVFMSTMSVYGMRNGTITDSTALKPFNLYGQSKFEAEKGISELEDDSFVVTIVRPPLVYGKGCKGNYVQLSAFAKKFPFFPDYESARSMIFVDNLSAFLLKAVEEKLSGVYCPQDECYVNTSDMVRRVALANGRNIRLTRVFNPLISLALKLKVNIVCKVFGSLCYDKSLCVEFDQVDFDTAIKKTES